MSVHTLLQILCYLSVLGFLNLDTPEGTSTPDFTPVRQASARCRVIVPQPRSMSSVFVSTCYEPSSSQQRDLRTFQNPRQHHPQQEAPPPQRRRHFIARQRQPPPRRWRPQAWLSPPHPLGARRNVRGALSASQALSLPSASTWGVEVRPETSSDSLGRVGKSEGPPLGSPGSGGRVKGGRRTADSGRPPGKERGPRLALSTHTKKGHDT